MPRPSKMRKIHGASRLEQAACAACSGAPLLLGRRGLRPSVSAPETEQERMDLDRGDLNVSPSIPAAAY